jgi:hypothetical protein
MQGLRAMLTDVFSSKPRRFRCPVNGGIRTGSADPAAAMSDPTFESYPIFFR